MENRKIRFHEKFIKSITDFSFYEIMSNQSTGKAIKYLLMLTITVGVLWLVKPVYLFNTGITKMVYSFNDAVPNFLFQDGQLSVEGKMPMVIGNDQNTIIIDTSGKSDASLLDRYHDGVFIGKDKIVQKKNGFETRNFDFSQLKQFTLTKADVANLIPLLRGINVFIFIFGLPWFFVSKLFSALILASIGMILAGIKKTSVKYGTMFRISIYSLTVPILIKVLLQILGVGIPHFWILYFVVGSVYVWNAIPVKKPELGDENGLLS